jgi:FAD/FMN-containing dehydrogenase
MATTETELAAALDGFAGEALQAGDEGYDAARRIHNGLIDRHPALIARCRGTADVVAAVNLARERGLELSVRGGGHNVSGRAVTDGGLMVELSLMRGIHVDPAQRTARAQGGVTWAELNRETQLHGLAVTGGVVSTTGIAGLTLGGGVGWTMAKFGLAVDNLLSAEVVTADGAVLTASESQNADLFWALRGGGGNLGVVTSFEYRLHPVGPMVTGGMVVHPFDAAEELLRFFRDFSAGMSDDLVIFAGLVHAPDGSGANLAGLVIGHIGTPEQARRELEPVLAFGSPVDVQVAPMPYTVLNCLIDDSFPTGALNYWKSSFLNELSDAAIATMVSGFASCPSPMTIMVLEPFHGEVTRIPVDATAVPHREQSYNLVIAGVWMDPAETDQNVIWVRDTFTAMEPYRSNRRYVNYLPDDEVGEDPVRAAYGPNYDRLAKLKATYDPANLFRMNQNIKPEAVA